VTALDSDPRLVAELELRARGLHLRAVEADARAFELDETFAVCLVPMQTIQLLEGAAGRAALLERVRRHLKPGGLLAIAIAERLELYEVADGEPHPLPDVCERDGVVYASRPTAIRASDGQFVIERRRETVDREGRREVEDHAISLDLVTAAELEREGRTAGLVPSDRATIAATRDYAGSEVVMLRA
jgi:SAM-dependent methyltransferase